MVPACRISNRTPLYPIYVTPVEARLKTRSPLLELHYHLRSRNAQAAEDHGGNGIRDLRHLHSTWHQMERADMGRPSWRVISLSGALLLAAGAASIVAQTGAA